MKKEKFEGRFTKTLSSRIQANNKEGMKSILVVVIQFQNSDVNPALYLLGNKILMDD